MTYIMAIGVNTVWSTLHTMWPVDVCWVLVLTGPLQYCNASEYNNHQFSLDVTHGTDSRCVAFLRLTAF